MKQFRSTLILVVIVALVGGYIYFNERGPVAEEGSTVLLSAGAGGPRDIRVTPHKGDGLQLFRVNDKWQVAVVKSGKSGNFVPADASLVKPFADSLTLIQSKNVLDNPSDLKDYGLKDPAVSISIDGQKLILGNKTKVDPNSVYALAGDHVAVIPSTILDSASKTFKDWRDKSILALTVDDVTSFSVKAPKLDASFSKSGDKWNIMAPVQAEAMNSSVETFLSTLSTTQSTAWLDDKGTSPERWGLDKPVATVTVGDQTLRIGKKLSGGYAGQNTASATVFQIPETVFAKVNQPLADWRDKRVANFLVADVTSLEVSSSGSTKKFEKVSDKWQEAGGKPNNDAHVAVEDLLYNAAGWNAKGFVDKPGADAAYGLDKPMTILKVATNSATFSLTLGEKGGKIYVRTGDGTLMELSPESLGTFKTSLKTLFAAKK